ncbi:ubiquitin-protein transferase activating protein [Serendipita sp. 397]|nr:ubiquitin-protein transferase activating protein [Serendipita sp. 397]KAG8802961.1 ubiquitin-protein transferase activating protein [Serendipita sp. 398]
MSTTTRKIPSKTKTPKAPARGRKEEREPLTPSLSHALNGLTLNNNTGSTSSNKRARRDPESISPDKSIAFGDPDKSINPFLETSVPLAPPTSSADPMLAAQRLHVQPLYAREKTGSSSTPGTSGSSSAATKVRKLPTQPERVLDAPGILDDYYLNLLTWSSRNELAVGLEESTYVWRASTGAAFQLTESTEGRWVTSLDWSADGAFLAIGMSNGDVELWDVEAERRLRTMTGHQAQVASLAWNNHILSSGCQDGSIWHHDVRVARHHQGTLLGHLGEICGLKWRSDGGLLASGGNDNVVNVWDSRTGDSDPNGEFYEQRTAKWTKRNHTAAVKAIAWCPWQDSLLATGGGTGDATVHFWNTNTGARVASLTTPGQVTSVHFTPLAKEFVTTHGYPTNSVMVHSYPSMTKIGEIKDAHDSRVIYSAISPSGDSIVTGAGDENIKFWKLWEVPPKKQKGSGKSSSSSVLTLR